MTLARREPMKRWKPKPERKVGKEGIVRLHGIYMELLRLDCWNRDKGTCQECGKRVFFRAHHSAPDSYHMAHIRNKRMYGDTLENVRALCGDCHRAEHGNKLPNGQ